VDLGLLYDLTLNEFMIRKYLGGFSIFLIILIYSVDGRFILVK